MSLSVSKWVIGIAALLVSLPLAADWPQWRGPNRDGVTQDFVVPTTWPATLKEVWKVTVGEGHSSPVTSEGRIYVLARQGEDEVVLCLEAQTGKQLWRTSYPAAYTMNPAATGHDKGPKSTPVVSGGKLFTFGIKRKERKIELAEGVFETIPQYVAAVWNCYVAHCGERAMHCACWWTRQRRVNGV